MTIEAKLDRIADLLEQVLAALSAPRAVEPQAQAQPDAVQNLDTTAPTPAPEPVPAAKRQEPFDLAGLRARFARLSAHGYRQQLLDLLARYGVSRLPDVAEDQLPEVAAELGELEQAVKEAA